MTSIRLLLLLAALTVAAAPALAEDATEPAGPTPVNDFAPDEVRPARGTAYDQGITINQVSIEGNKLIPEDQIKQAMVIRPGSLYSKRALQSDLKRIYDLGYFTEKMKAVPVATRDGIHLRIEVEENAPITGVNIEGNTLLKSDDLQQIFASQTGLPQNIGQLNESIEKIEKLYADKGYVLARVKSIQDDPDGVITLEVNEGMIDQVEFIGNRKTKDFALRRMMGTKAGQVYNEKLLGEDLKRLFAAQSFSDVRRVITVSPDNPDRYNLTIEVDEKKTGAISVGGGFDTNFGLFGSAGYSDPNFLGRGQSFNSGASIGSGIVFRDSTQANARTYQFEVGWTNPSLFDTPNALSVNAYGRDLASFNVPLGIERRIGVETTWSRPLMSMKNTSASLNLRGEDIGLREFASQARLRELGLDTRDRKDFLKGGTFVSLSPTIAYDTRDNRFNPSTGWLNTLSVTGAFGLNADSYGTATANLRRYFKIRDGVVLALNAQAGQALMGDIPTFNQYRMGGIFSVRGFQEGGLGIGNGFGLATAELRTKFPMMGKLQNIPVANSLSLAFFADAGTLIGQSNLNKVLDRDGFGFSVGAGVRFNIPGLGPIRLDYAIPISGGNSDFYRRFNFGIGQKF